MSAKPADKPKVVKPPVDNSNTYIWIFLIVIGIALCTKFKFAWIGNDFQAIAIDITSKIGNDKANDNKLKNVIHLTISNPFTSENFERAKDIIAGNKEVKGEFLDREISVTPKSKVQPTPKQSIGNEIEPDRE